MGCEQFSLLFSWTFHQCFMLNRAFPLVICIFMLCVFVEAVTTSNPNTNHFQILKSQYFRVVLIQNVLFNDFHVYLAIVQFPSHQRRQIIPEILTR